MRRLLFVVLVACLAAFIHTEVFLTVRGQQIESYVADLWFALRGEIASPEDVIIIALDEDSYQELEQPFNKAWPRELHAALLERLASAGVKRVAFDVLFYGASDNPQADRRLAEALAKLPTVIGAEISTSVGQLAIEQLLLPYQPFRDAVEQVALVQLPIEKGFIRNFRVDRPEYAQHLTSLAAAAVGHTATTIGGPSNRDLIWFYGPAGTIETYSFYEALDPEILPDEWLKGKVAFVGLMLRSEIGPAQKDTFLTPFWPHGRTFGIEIHANAAANLLSRSWIRRLPMEDEAFLLATLAFLMGALVILLQPLQGAIALLLFLSLWVICSYVSFIGGLFLPGAMLTLLVLPLLYLCSTMYYYFVVQAEQRKSMKALELYLSPQMAKQVKKNPGALQLQGQTFECTAIFTDIASFTNISESMQADEVARMLNAYFDRIVHSIQENHGVLIKFIGDAIFAIWGAPLKREDHADLAVKTAKQLHADIEAFNQEGNFPKLFTRIGVHSGPMFVGNYGASVRFDFTALGDAVNFASRLEGLNKYFGTSLLISEKTRDQLSSSNRFVRMGRVQAKGKQQGINVFTPIDSPDEEILAQSWESALQSFESQDWLQAGKGFRKLRKEQKYETAAGLYLAQINLLQVRDVQENWDGSIVFEMK